MSYQVLARKWRPGTFAELVGQEHVQRALINALDNNRLHHAFLFTGTRGVGKTTIARIFAKSLNCETGITSKPCGQCNTCIEIAEGRFVDLIEVDAASRTKVEDTRDLLENVQYAPTCGRYKVYLIDEVHMLSTHSFNALLKTLEEPPPHVKFLLATTDPQKLPVTILSRCLQFNLKRLPAEDIKQYLHKLLQLENIEFEENALAQLARAADGSMRDALSLLDQAIAFGAGKVLNDDVQSMLGSIDQQYIADLIELVHKGQGNELMQKALTIAESSPDYSNLLGEVISFLQQMAIYQLAPQAALDTPQPERLQNLAQQLSPEDVQLFYQIALIGRRDLPFAPEPRSAFEMTMLRMLAFRPDTAAPVGPQTRKVQKPASTEQGVGEVANKVKPDKPAASQGVMEPTPGNSLETFSELELRWDQLSRSLGLGGLVQQLAMHCSLISENGNKFKLALTPSQRHLISTNRSNSLQEALQKQIPDSLISIEIQEHDANTPAAIHQYREAAKQKNAEKEIYNDTTVQSLMETFGAQPDSIKPN